MIYTPPEELVDALMSVLDQAESRHSDGEDTFTHCPGMRRMGG